MLDFLYNVFIMPVESIVEFIFYYMDRIFPDNPAYSIVFVSLVINLLILPLYKRADDMQSKEREKVKSMERWNKHIRKTFKGDERYMMQTAYYRIEGYKPFYAITGSLSLLFQVPFFIAAYHFLSNLDLLEGVGFFLIPDMGAPDGILKIGGLSVNVLPILMTTINIISGYVYTKGFKLKDKLQLYIMALLFLVVLYQSPSGLVLYWTCNNLFSLFKNIFSKLGKYKRPAINIVSALAGTGLYVKLITSHRLLEREQYIVFALVMVLSFVPALLSLLKNTKLLNTTGLKEKIALKPIDTKDLNRMFWLGALVNTIILGVMIPAALINSSPVEFGTLVHTGPLSLILYTASYYIGMLLVWIGIFYAISDATLKRIFAYGLWILAVCSLINYYAFYGKFGTMDYELIFVDTPVYSGLGKLINLLVLVPIVLLLIMIARRWPKLVKSVLSVLVLMTVILSGVSIYNTQMNLVDEGYYEMKKDSTISPTVPLSKDGKNVIVLMLDRAISEYIPYIFQEKPEIAEQFSDFIYYPNTISYGGITNVGVPALMGGYEYTPTEMNKRSDELLVDKHNEALKVLPVLFAENGYQVSVVDPPYANYKEYPDPSIYDEYENINGYTTKDKYADYEYYSDDEKTAQKKHIAAYSLFRTAPVFLQDSIYDDGNYLSKPINGEGLGYSYAAEGYATLDYLDEYVYIEKDDTNRLLVMTNLLTHEPTYLETPEYVLGNDVEPFPLSEEITSQYVIDGKVLNMDLYSSVQHYHVNVAAYKLLGEFFDYLKEQGVYDNTRIIIVSDHGWPVLQMDDVALDDNTWIETFNPVLLVKDFADSDALVQGTVNYLEVSNLRYDETFMTNADVATLAVTGLIDNPVNPFTGKEINNDEKTAHTQIISSSRNFDVGTNNGTVYDFSDYPWVEFLGGDVKDKNNWRILYDKE